MTLGDAFNEYVKSLKPDLRQSHFSYVSRFIDFAGHETLTAAITGARVESFAESNIKASDPSAADRVAALKNWFQYLKKRNYTTANYGINVRLRRSTGSRPTSANAVRINEVPIEMTAEGIETLKKDLDELTAIVPQLVTEISKAREDKDFRENSPLEAAREALAYNESQRRQLEATLKRAVVVNRKLDDNCAVGSMVTVTRLDDGRQFVYRLVGAREANAREMKISVESPVGRQLLGRRAGDQVSVEAPSGTIGFRVDEVAQPQ
jgi:transcription elongation factor GreA